MDYMGSNNQAGWPNVQPGAVKKIVLIPIDKKRQRKMEKAIEDAMKRKADAEAKEEKAEKDLEKLNVDSDGESGGNEMKGKNCPVCNRPMSQHPLVMGNMHEDCKGMPRPS